MHTATTIDRNALEEGMKIRFSGKEGNLHNGEFVGYFQGVMGTFARVKVGRIPVKTPKISDVSMPFFCENPDEYEGNYEEFEIPVIEHIPLEKVCVFRPARIH